MKGLHPNQHANHHQITGNGLRAEPINCMLSQLLAK